MFAACCFYTCVAYIIFGVDVHKDNTPPRRPLSLLQVLCFIFHLLCRSSIAVDQISASVAHISDITWQ